MVASSLAGSVLLLALGFSQQVAAACTRTITARPGDTCASLAAEAGITVTDFLRSNPSVTSCSQLVAGGTYCVQGTADSAPTPSSTSSSSSPASSPTGLGVSTDGSCGNGITCAGSSFGPCCSPHGYCGSTDDYCGTGCQPEFGSCGSGVGATTPAVTVTVTVTDTTITAVTRTSLVYQTSTLTDIITRTKTTTAATATVTLTTIKTSTSTRTVDLTSFSINTITSIVTSTRVVTSNGCGTPTTPITTTTTQVQPGNPSPTLPGTPRNCKDFDLIQRGDTCRSIAIRNGLSLLEFYSLNPSVSADTIVLCTGDLPDLVLSGLCQISCDALWPGYYVCVGR
ncbi:carbohydrate-binding module family 18 protein [Thermothielavioides terrestris NRRL 8126]|uniref:Carbohydrate-binding module family 18 protein n=1 Tax=Thermothielavioides terrestris (strain ATCC 38088 / NRRL 8126) TaxID=578455 RepID=G2QYT9_THETT|nr:carbohydrate-binding module family 18 protein [Thermothielavioides terrestris NRRL 8126]AEO66281.1 carbohydrate-binding module family 18 protein [Thermothielavioides terrestris NRRL 8126]